MNGLHFDCAAAPLFIPEADLKMPHINNVFACNLTLN